MAESKRWIEEAIEREKRRLEEAGRFRQAIGPFTEALCARIQEDLLYYFEAFPDERQRLQWVCEGPCFFVGLRDDPSHLAHYLRRVDIHFNVDTRVVACSFSGKVRVDYKVFALNLTSDGSLALVEGSIESLSEYILRPVLFYEPKDR